MSDTLLEYLDQRSRQVSGERRAAVDLRALPEAVWVPQRRLLDAHLASLSPQEADRVAYFLQIGSYSMNDRSMLLDGEVEMTVSGPAALAGMFDVLTVAGMTTWIELPGTDRSVAAAAVEVQAAAGALGAQSPLTPGRGVADGPRAAAGCPLPKRRPRRTMTRRRGRTARFPVRTALSGERISSMKKAIVALVLIATAGAVATALYRQRGGPDIGVTSAPVTRGDIVDAVGATGALQAVTTVLVGSQVSGNIQWLGADFNSIVKRGQVIARLDPSMFDAQLQQVEASLSQARANLVKAESDLDRTRVQLLDAQQKFARASELASRLLLAQSELDAAKIAVDTAEAAVASQQATVTQTRAAVRQSEASVNQSKVNRDHTIIVAPIDGIVTERSVDVGQTVAASMQAPTLFVIAADLKQMQVLASVDEADVGRIRPNQHVTFRVDAYPTETFEGTVSQVRLQPTVVQNVTTYGTLITSPNPQLKLKPGMTATVKIEVAHRANALRVSNLALRFRPTTEMFAALDQPPCRPTRRALAADGAAGERRCAGQRGASPAVVLMQPAGSGARIRRHEAQRTGTARRRPSGAPVGTLRGDVRRGTAAVHRADEATRRGHERFRVGRADAGWPAPDLDAHRRRAAGADHRRAVRAAASHRIARSPVALHGPPAQARERATRRDRRLVHRAARHRPAGGYGNRHRPDRRHVGARDPGGGRYGESPDSHAWPRPPLTWPRRSSPPATS